VPDRGKRAVDVQKTTIPHTALQGNQGGPHRATYPSLPAATHWRNTPLDAAFRYFISRDTAAFGRPLGQWTIIIPSLKTAIRSSRTFSFRFLWLLKEEDELHWIHHAAWCSRGWLRSRFVQTRERISVFESFKIQRSIIRELIHSSQSILEKSSKRYHKIDHYWRFSGTRSIRRQRVAEFSGHPKGILIKFSS